MSLSQYLLEFSICLALFYGLYHLLLRRETFFQLNRWYLLLSPALSMIIPFLDWQLPNETSQSNWDQLVVPLVYDIQRQQIMIWETLEKPPAPTWSLTYLDLLLLLYLIGVCWMGAKLLHRTWRLMKLIGRGKQQTQSGYTVVTSEERIPAASFLSYIFWEEGPLSAERQTILEHELVHVRQWHSLDVLLMEVWVMLKWFHPFIYWYRQSLRITHEYIADAYVSATKGSRFEYAKLLTNTQPMAVDNQLLHQFNSSIKMRLLMLAKNQSSSWKYLKFLAVVPVTVVLMLLFSFNLSEDLPEPFVKPLVDMESNLNNLAQRPLLPVMKAPSKTMLDKKYTLQWGDLECSCRSEQFPNYYHCENQSLLPGELRRLIRQVGGFELRLEDQPQAIRELTAVSKYMKDMGGFQGQFDEMDEEFNADSPLWKQTKKGDIFRFTFRNDEGDHFVFEVVINNRKEEYIFGSQIEMGDLHINVDLTNEAAVVHLDVDELQRKAQSPFRIRKNRDTFHRFSSVKITNSSALRQDQWENLNTTELDISRSKAIMEAFPGDRISIEAIDENGKKIQFNALLRKNSAWDGRERDHAIYWGDHIFNTRQYIFLTKAALAELLEKEMYLFANGAKHLIKGGITDMETFSMIGNKPEEKKVSESGIIPIRNRKEMLSEYQPGHQVHFMGFNKKIDGYLMPPIKLIIDFDWKAVFADRPGIIVAEATNTLTIPNAEPEDLERVLNLENFVPLFYEIEVDGTKYNGVYGREMKGFSNDKPHLEALKSQGLPQEKLVVRRVDLLNARRQ